eukprot:1061323-Amphidinium_carterae.1
MKALQARPSTAGLYINERTYSPNKNHYDTVQRHHRGLVLSRNHFDDSPLTLGNWEETHLGVQLVQLRCTCVVDLHSM